MDHMGPPVALLPSLLNFEPSCGFHSWDMELSFTQPALLGWWQVSLVVLCSEQSGSDIAKDSWAPALDCMLLGCMEEGLEWVVSWLYSLTPSDASTRKTRWRGRAEYSASPAEAFFRAYSGNIDRMPSCKHRSFHRE